MDQDYDKALEQFEIASRLSPSNADTRRLIAAIERRQGKWQAALEAYELVAKLDPQNPSTARELLYTNSSMRRWPEAARWADQMRAWLRHLWWPKSKAVTSISSGKEILVC
jgi:tetratricopeptide (TPR) repeat protein